MKDFGLVVSKSMCILCIHEGRKVLLDFSVLNMPFICQGKRSDIWLTETFTMYITK